jgi:hypothetical protein
MFTTSGRPRLSTRASNLVPTPIGPDEDFTDECILGL